MTKKRALARNGMRKNHVATHSKTIVPFVDFAGFVAEVLSVFSVCFRGYFPMTVIPDGA